MHRIGLAAAVVLNVALWTTATATQGRGTSPDIRGVWQVTEIQQTGPDARTIRNPQPGLYIFTDRHFSIMRVNGDKPRSDINAATATAEQLRAVFDDGFLAQAGTYEVAGSTLRTRPTVSKEPRIMAPGAFTEYAFAVEGPTVTLTNVRSQTGRAANPTTVRLVRLE